MLPARATESVAVPLKLDRIVVGVVGIGLERNGGINRQPAGRTLGRAINGKIAKCVGAATGGGVGIGVTTMVEAVPVIDPSLLTSVSDCVPPLPKVTGNDACPLLKVTVTGKFWPPEVALPSLLLSVAVPE